MDDVSKEEKWTENNSWFEKLEVHKKMRRRPGKRKNKKQKIENMRSSKNRIGKRAEGEKGKIRREMIEWKKEWRTGEGEKKARKNKYARACPSVIEY